MLATISHSNSITIAEVAFLLILIGGVWLAFSMLQRERWQTLRTVVAGTLFAIAGALLIVAAHWGSFG